MTQAMVSAVMVTGKDPERVPYARAAIKSFLAQTWLRKELIIVNHGETPLLSQNTTMFTMVPTRKMVIEHMIAREPLGAMRNIGTQHAIGDFITPWDDDDWSHPTRLEYQMKSVRADHITTLEWQVRYSFLNKNAFAARSVGIRNNKNKTCGHPNTAIIPREWAVYEPIERHEDTRILRDRDVYAINNCGDRVSGLGPALYLRFFTGMNVWDSRHVMRKFAHETRAWDLGDPAAEYLRDTLAAHYNRR